MWPSRPDPADVLIIVGAMLVAGGLWMVYPPAAPISLGAALIAIGLWRLL